MNAMARFRVMFRVTDNARPRFRFSVRAGAKDGRVLQLGWG